MDNKQLTAVMIAHGNDMALEAMKLAGVPLARAQALVLSVSWRQLHRGRVADRLKQLMGRQARSEKTEAQCSS